MSSDFSAITVLFTLKVIQNDCSFFVSCNNKLQYTEDINQSFKLFNTNVLILLKNCIDKVYVLKVIDRLK